MDLDSMSRLKLDVRMARRRGWIEEKDLEAALEKLPDVADKAVRSEVDPPSEEG